MRRPLRRRQAVTEAPPLRTEPVAPQKRPMRRRARAAPITPAAPPTQERLQPRPIPIVLPPPAVSTAAFVSQINPVYPVHGDPTTQSVRDNFTFAKHEIEGLYNQGGGGAIPDDAPSDGKAYGRQSSAWSQVIAATGDVVDGGNF